MAAVYFCLCASLTARTGPNSWSGTLLLLKLTGNTANTVQFTPYSPLPLLPLSRHARPPARRDSPTTSMVAAPRALGNTKPTPAPNPWAAALRPAESVPPPSWPEPSRTAGPPALWQVPPSHRPARPNPARSRTPRSSASC